MTKVSRICGPSEKNWQVFQSNTFLKSLLDYKFVGKSQAWRKMSLIIETCQKATFGLLWSIRIPMQQKFYSINMEELIRKPNALKWNPGGKKSTFRKKREFDYRKILKTNSSLLKFLNY